MNLTLLLPLIPLVIIAVLILSPHTLFAVCYKLLPNFRDRVEMDRARYEGIISELRKQMGDALYADVNLCMHELVNTPGSKTPQAAQQLWQEKGIYRHPAKGDLITQLEYYTSGANKWDPLYRWMRARIHDTVKEMQLKALEKDLDISLEIDKISFVQKLNPVAFVVSKKLSDEDVKTMKNIATYSDDGTSCRS